MITTEVPLYNDALARAQAIIDERDLESNCRMLRSRKKNRQYRRTVDNVLGDESGSTSSGEELDLENVMEDEQIIKKKPKCAYRKCKPKGPPALDMRVTRSKSKKLCKNNMQKTEPEPKTDEQQNSMQIEDKDVNQENNNVPPENPIQNAENENSIVPPENNVQNTENEKNIALPENNVQNEKKDDQVPTENNVQNKEKDANEDESNNSESKADSDNNQEESHGEQGQMEQKNKMQKKKLNITKPTEFVSTMYACIVGACKVKKGSKSALLKHIKDSHKSY